MGEVFPERISCSMHFTVNPRLLAEGWCRMMAASERWRQQSRMEYPGRPVSNQASSKMDSTLLLVGSAPPTAVRTSPVEDTGCGWAARVPTTTHEEGLPSPNQQRSALETCPLPLQIEEVQIQMDTPL